MDFLAGIYLEEKIAIRTRYLRAYNNHDESNSERESNT